MSEQKIAGKYFCREKGDTLSLFSNKTYGYTEKLNNGELGWNKGNWSLNKRNVSFFDTKPLPVVGYALQKTIAKATKEPLQLKLLLNNSEKILKIETAIALLNNKQLDSSFFTVKSNLLTIRNLAFDLSVDYNSLFSTP